MSSRRKKYVIAGVVRRQAVLFLFFPFFLLALEWSGFSATVFVLPYLHFSLVLGSFLLRTAREVFLIWPQVTRAMPLLFSCWLNELILTCCSVFIHTHRTKKHDLSGGKKWSSLTFLWINALRLRLNALRYISYKVVSLIFFSGFVNSS
jgi:hypothetical protein